MDDHTKCASKESNLEIENAIDRFVCHLGKENAWDMSSEGTAL